ncbi:MAG: biopolymer transporter ExbD [Vicinamibacterales bacterium]
MPKVQPIPTSSSSRGGRRGRSARVSTSLAEINVVPLVDVMLVLLIIFMVAAPMMTQGMQVNLPPSRRSQPVQAEPVYVTVPASFAKDHIVQIGNDDIRVEILGERIRQVLQNREDKSVFLRADGSVQYRDLVTVWDQLKGAGVEHIGAVTRPIGER